MWLWVTLHTYTSQLQLMSVAVKASRARSAGRLRVSDRHPSSPRSSNHEMRNTHDQSTRWAITWGAGTPLKGWRYTGNKPQRVKAAAAAARPRGESRATVILQRAGRAALE